MRSLPYVLADVFTDTPLQGNQLAIFTDPGDLPDERMRALARETNLSETVFLLAPVAGGTARVRIFTPAAELPFAGHPILGTAVVVALREGLDEVVLETGRGPVLVRVRRDGALASRGQARVASGAMDQPVPTWEPHPRADEVLAALGVRRAALPVEVYDNGPRHTVVVLGAEEEVAALRPDLASLAALGVQAECAAGSGRRWKARNFAPTLGVAEDPATGSAAGPLAVHLARHGAIAFGEEIEVRQGGEIGRPSLLRATAHGSAQDVRRVEVAGSAVVVAEGAYAL